jgi:L-erythro-3,5-diaminohexanoate dehydrogenase
VRPFELEIAVERLCLDSTSYRGIAERSDGDPDRMAERITHIVEARGKMHNPHTGSGGVLLGTVAAIGERYESPPAVGERIVTLASLTLIPLRLDVVTEPDPRSPQVDVSGIAYLSQRAAWAPLPDDLTVEGAVAMYDVCAAASQTRELAPPGGVVYVLGAGHAGKLALAAARDATGDGAVVAVDADPDAVERVLELGLADIGVTADLRDPIAALEAVRGAGAPAADLTVVVVNAGGCEPAAILLTADGGTVLFFSMATSFSAAALAADGIGTSVRMIVGSGYSADRGEYALGLARRSDPLRRALDLHAEQPA